MNQIDIVVTWVDGNDPKWRQERKKYLSHGDSNEVRYRDWNLLRYWFRCIEKNAPWVRKVHFVTYGHIPEWLNVEHPKLNIVKHEDFIPIQYLPTFNSVAIELNLHRIKDLSEQFIYFNDDVFLLDKVDETYFFKNGLPCDSFLLNPILFKKDSIGWLYGSNTAVINEHFNLREVVRKNLGKVFHYRNGLKRNLKNLMLIGLLDWFPWLESRHLSTSFLKKTYEEVWEKEPDVLNETCLCRFREKTNVTQMLIRDWQLASGTFEPVSYKTGRCFQLTDARLSEVKTAIEKKKYKVICINDSNNLSNWKEAAELIKESFESVYPDKSYFER